MSHLDPLVSPALSAASNMSSLFDLSNDTSSSRSDGSDDEIIYNFSEVPSLSANEFSRIAVSSDDDFVVLSRPRSQRSTPETEVFNHDEEALAGASGITDLVAGLADLAITPTSGRRRRCKGKAPQIPVSAAGTVAKKKKPKKKNKNKSQPSSVDAAASSSSSGSLPHSKRAASTTLVTEKRKVAKSEPSKVKKEKSNGLSGRPLVENLSDKFSDYGESDVGSPSMYEEAFAFITSFLSNPAARKDSACRLTLLQALIIELGLAKSSLPCSLRAAKAYLKSRAFLNINEYIAVRDQGPAAVQRILYPSRTALIKDIRKNKTKAPRGWVKDHGLQVLLVKCYQ